MAGTGLLSFQRRLAAGAMMLRTSPTRAAPVWFKLERRGSVITAHSSSDGATWSLFGSETVALSASVYAGLAVTSANVSAAATAILDNVALTTANQPPSVALTEPATGAAFTAPANITMTADATDTDGTIAKVDFYQGSTLIGSDTTSPYSITWSNVAAASYSLTTVATDDDGASTTSAARSITVTAPPNQPPSVALTAPAAGASFTAPANITVSADASDTDGTIARVDFYQGSTLIGSDTTSPYSLTWSSVSIGAYSLTAVANDDDSATTTSAARTITVTAPAHQPPSVALTGPASGASFTAPANITVSADASDTDGTIVGVDFYQGSTLIGSDTTSPYSIVWSNVFAGAYSLTAVARDNAGAPTTSIARSVTVTVGLPTGWTAADIGNPAIAGSSIQRRHIHYPRCR